MGRELGHTLDWVPSGWLGGFRRGCVGQGGMVTLVGEERWLFGTRHLPRSHNVVSEHLSICMCSQALCVQELVCNLQ